MAAFIPLPAYNVGSVHSSSPIVSVAPLPLAEAAITYKGLTPLRSDIFLYQPFPIRAVLGVVIFPASSPVKSTVTLLSGSSVLARAVLDLFQPYTIALLVPAVHVPPAFDFVKN